MVRRRIVLAALLLALFALGWWVGRGSTGDLYANLDVFIEVLHKVEDNYVDRVDARRVVDGAIRGMLKQLDPYSQYLDARDLSSLQAVTEGKFSGIGVVVGVRGDHPTVISAIEGTPAWEGGLRSGDVILRIDDVVTASFTVEDAAQHLRGLEGSRVRLEIRREGEEETHEVTLVRREIRTPSVPYAFVLPGKVGYLRLANFSERSGVEVRSAIERLRADGARRLVLDLRSNPGGLLDQAVDVAEQFLPRGTMVVYTQGRSRGQDQRFRASEAHPVLDWPMVALVDEGTASASEIVAGALQDHDRALVIGRTTFGKGSVQSVFPLRGRDAALKLTTAAYHTPSGRSIHRPVEDLAAEADEDAEADPQAAPADSARPAFRTDGGRTVYGGGGIKPDVTVALDSLPPLALAVEQRGLAFRFANRWVNTHPAAKAVADRPMWEGFVAYLGGQGVAFTPGELAAQRPALERALRRELARRSGGDAGAMRVVLEDDPVVRRARSVLAAAGTPRDVFAAAATRGDSGRQ